MCYSGFVSHQYDAPSLAGFAYAITRQKPRHGEDLKDREALQYLQYYGRDVHNVHRLKDLEPKEGWRESEGAVRVRNEVEGKGEVFQ